MKRKLKIIKKEVTNGDVLRSLNNMDLAYWLNGTYNPNNEDKEYFSIILNYLNQKALKISGYTTSKSKNK